MKRRQGPSLASTSANGAAALLLLALGGHDDLRLGIPRLAWKWDDDSAPPLERTPNGLANSLTPHRQCFELPTARPVPLIGVFVGLATIASHRKPAWGHGLRRACSIFVVYILGGIVDVPEIALAATAAITTHNLATEVAVWVPPIGALVLGANGGGDLSLILVACVIAWLSAMSHAIDGRSEAFGTALAYFYVVAFCIFETFTGFRWISPHC